MDNKSNTLTEAQKQELRDLTLTEFFNLEERTSVQKSLLTAFKGFLESVDGEDQVYSKTIDDIGEDIFLVCALLDYLKHPGQEESLYDLRGVLHFKSLQTLDTQEPAPSCHE